MRYAIFAAGLLASAIGAVAQAADTPAPADPQPKEQPTDIVCADQVAVGTHIRRRVCMTRAARDAQTKDDQNAMASMRSGSAASPSSGAGAAAPPRR